MLAKRLNTMNKRNSKGLVFRNKSTLLTVFLLAGILVGCDRNDNDDNTGGLLDNPGDANIVVPDSTSGASGVLLRVIDENGDAVLDPTVLVIDDVDNGNIVPDDFETLQAETGSVLIPLLAFEGVGVLRLEIEKVGFFDGGGRFEVLPADNSELVVVLTSSDANAEGIKVTQSSGDLSTGELTSTVQTEDGEAILSSVVIPQGLEITSVDGEVLDNSDLRVSIVNYDSQDDQALLAFPGGFELTIDNIDDVDIPFLEGTIPTQSTEPVDPRVTVRTLGFSTIEVIDSAGRAAENFSGTFRVVIAIPAQTINPATLNPISVGDQVAIMSFNSDTANWTYEGRQSIQQSSTGGFQVSFETDHLTTYAATQITQAYCSPDPVFSVSVVSSDFQDVSDQPLTARLRGAGEDGNGYSRTESVTGGRSFSLSQVVETFDVRFSFSTPNPDVNIAGVTLGGSPYNGGAINPCSTGGASFQVTLDVPLVDIPTPVDVSVTANVQSQCTNIVDSPVQPIAGATTWLDTGTTTVVRSTQGTTGTSTLSASVDTSTSSTVTVSSIYDGITQSRTLAIDTSLASQNFNETFIYPVDDCVLVTGAVGS